MLLHLPSSWSLFSLYYNLQGWTLISVTVDVPAVIPLISAELLHIYTSVDEMRNLASDVKKAIYALSQKTEV